MSEKFSLEDIQKIDDSIDTAREQDKPFAVYSGGDDISVVGDANKTELEKMDVKVVFRYDKEEFHALFESMPEGAKETTNFVIFSHTFKDVFVNPRQDTLLAEGIVKLVPYFQEYERISQEVDEKYEKVEKEFNAKFISHSDGTITTTLKDEKRNAEMLERRNKIDEKMTTDMIHFYNYSSEDIRNGVYEIVGSLLGLDIDMLNHVTGISAINAMIALFTKFPDLWNESEILFY